VADITDIKARSEYDRWLEERRDWRYFFTQRLTSAVEQICHHAKRAWGFPFFPKLESPAWINILGYRLFHDIQLFPEFWDLRDIFWRYATPMLDIDSESVEIDRVAITSSRFGGPASLPADAPWPTCSQGPLSFVAQIALEEIQITQAATSLPTNGWLSFFALNDRVGGNREDQDARVLYFPGDAKLDWRESPKDIDITHSLGHPCRLRFTESWDLPDEEDFVITEQDRERLEQIKRDHDLDDVRKDWNNGSHLLGYSRHNNTSDPSPASDWRNLLCLSSYSNPNLGWNWCDGERLCYFIKETDLRALRFDRVFGYAS
jgi:uncharacterized protein YwqG